MKKEIWKEVKDYPDYLVSSKGKVKSKARIVFRKDGSCLPIKEAVLRPRIGTTGYYVLTLYKNKKGKTCKVHQLVAIAFLGHTPCGYDKVINHKDLNKLNNDVDNLEIITARENSNLKHIKSSSQYVGVHLCNGKWRAVISVKKKQTHLGYFHCEKEASNAYQEALNKL